MDVRKTAGLRREEEREGEREKKREASGIQQSMCRWRLWSDGLRQRKEGAHKTKLFLYIKILLTPWPFSCSNTSSFLQRVDPSAGRAVPPLAPPYSFCKVTFQVPCLRRSSAWGGPPWTLRQSPYCKPSSHPFFSLVSPISP